jgi:hypothetical protein
VQFEMLTKEMRKPAAKSIREIIDRNFTIYIESKASRNPLVIKKKELEVILGKDSG